MRTVVANELRSYREAIAQAFGKLRPGIEVSAVEPEDFDEEVQRLRPIFVVCSRVTSAVERPRVGRALPGLRRALEGGLWGEITRVEGIQFGDFLDLLGRTRDLATLG